MKRISREFFYFLSAIFCFGCSDMSTTKLFDANWPEATLYQIDFHQGWPDNKEAIPPLFAIVSKASDGKYLYMASMILGEGENRRFGIQLGWSEKEIIPGSVTGSDHFIFVRYLKGEPGSEQYVRYEHTNEARCRNRYYLNSDDEMIRKMFTTVVNVGEQLNTHFQTFPNNEQSIPAELKQQVIQIWKGMFSFPPWLKAFPADGCS